MFTVDIKQQHTTSSARPFRTLFLWRLDLKVIKIIGKNDFSYHCKKINVRYKKIGFNIDILRQTACLLVNQIKINSFAYLFNFTTVGRASD